MALIPSSGGTCPPWSLDYKDPVTGIRFHGFTSCLNGNDENDHEKATYLNTQSTVD